MDVGFLLGFLFVFVVIILLVGFFVIPNAIPSTITTSSTSRTPALLASTPPTPSVAPTQVLTRPSVPPVPEPELEEENGTPAYSDLGDSRFQLESIYPGMVGEELVLTKPIRRFVKLCEQGGFLRRYGTGPWQVIPYIVIDGNKVYYDKIGFFRVGDSRMKRLVLRYMDQNYVLEIVPRT